MSDVSPGTTAAPSGLELAIQLHARGQLDAAAQIYSDLLDRAPVDARLLTQLGLVRLQQNRLDDAGALLDRAVAANPAAADAHAWRGEALRRRKALEPAIEAFHAALARNADFAPALFNLALAENERGDAATARTAWRRFSELRPADPRVSRELGRLAYECGDYADAVVWFARQFERTPDDADAAYLAGMALDRLARLDEAIQWFAKASKLAPQRAAIHNAAGVAHFNLGNLGEALDEYRAALALDPDFREAHGNLLMALHHVLPPDHDGLFAEHIAWAARHAKLQSMPRAAFANDRDPRRRLKIGYLSPRFCGGPLEHFFLPLLEAHDPARVHITCYAVSEARDDATAAMRARADVWRDAAMLDDEALVEMIRGDAIDILVDLVGHCPGHRLGVFARRGAPIQFTWMDYVGTTGLSTVDYIVTDALHTPVGGPQRYTEHVLRLPDTRLCYRPMRSLPPLSASPSSAGGFITFGCFNRLNKLGPEVIATWSKILARVPRSRLLLRATAFQAEQTRAMLRGRFASHGIDAHRLDLRAFVAEAQMMREYAEVDVVLDPFPYNGCTTTCDALSMGVPVVSIEGSSLAGRHGVALLTACGLSGWVAQTSEEYVERAVSAAQSDVLDSTLRASLREQFLASPVCDGPRYARAFEQLFRDTWTTWCGSGE